MNERIRELWAKCVIKHTKDPMNWQTVSDEFAELIVNEVFNIIENERFEIYPTVLQKVKHHFGIEDTV